MDLAYTSDHQAFEREVRSFLASQWEPLRGPRTGRAEVDQFREKATARGYLNRSIPKAYGGSEQPPDVIKAQIIRDEFTNAGAPMEVAGQGMSMLVPVLLECGADWQKERFIQKTMCGEYKWAQGYSEPGSGSDLASLKSRAELVGDQWVINGHKIWTTGALDADYMFALLRTEPYARKHAGLSYILFDFRQPGVNARPIRQLTGGADFCEVFLENVRTPADWIVGRRGHGWEVSKVNLKHERNAVGSSSRFLPMFRKLVELARRTSLDGRPAIEHPVIRNRLAALDGLVQAQVCAGFYQLTLASRGEPAGLLGLTNKISMSNIGHEIAAIASEILGATALKMPDPSDRGRDEKWVNQIFGSLGIAIAAGTANIQRNIIAELGLGLPREPTDV